MNKSLKISVVIPVKNEAKKVRACIDGILKQTIKVHEVIIIDSGSTDGTQKIVKEYECVKLFEISPHSFNHGETRNLGVSLASGEYVLFTVGDARAYNEYWIEELLNGFKDNDVVGVCGQQIVPHEIDKNPMEWFYPISNPGIIRYQFKRREDFIALSPLEKKNICIWDDVNAMYLRNALIKTPFRKTSYCEDAIWASDVILNGSAIVYNHNSKVYHYHQEDPDFTFKKTFTILYFQFRHFNLVPKFSTIGLKYRLSVIKHSFKRSTGFNLFKLIFWYRYNLRTAKAVKKAHLFFLKVLNESSIDEVDKIHQSLCGKPPIPIK